MIHEHAIVEMLCRVANEEITPVEAMGLLEEQAETEDAADAD